MDNQEFEQRFDVLYNNITSNQAPGLNTYEKCVFLTKAQNETVKNKFSANSKGNTLGQGFDDSAKRQSDFSSLLMTNSCLDITLTGYLIKNGTSLTCKDRTNSDSTSKTTTQLMITSVEPSVSDYSWTDIQNGEYKVYKATSNSCYFIYDAHKYYMHLDVSYSGAFPYVTDVPIITPIDVRSTIFTYPSEVFIPVHDYVTITDGRILQALPLAYTEYSRLMSKPFKRPLKNQAWKLLNSGNGTTATKYVEIIAGPNDTIDSYTISYVRCPKPIIIGDLDGLTIDGYSYGADITPQSPEDNKIYGDACCELDPILHEEILQRAVELAKIAWTAIGQDNAQLEMAAGQRSE